MNCYSLDFWTGDVSKNIERMHTGYNPIREFNEFVNELILPAWLNKQMYDWFGVNGGYYAASYLRDFVSGCCVYWGAAGIWHLLVYVVFRDSIFTKSKRPLPSTAIILDSMMLAQSSLFMYVALPVFSTFLIENKLTQVYFYVDEIGGPMWYWIYLLIYMVFVEIGIYWMHRVLHTNKTLYKYIHSLHHKYNSAVTLTPWTYIAFHPVDGILQVSDVLLLVTFFIYKILRF